MTTRHVRPIVFPPFRLDTANQQLWRGEETLALRPKTFAVLVYLLERPGQLVTKEELLDACWPDTTMTYTVLKVCIREIREALGDDAKSPRFIETAHRRGYRFIGKVEEEREREREGQGDKGTRGQGEGETASASPGLPVSLSPCLPLSPAPPLTLSGAHRLSGAWRRAALLPAAGLVGRASALAQMRDWLARAARGERQVCFVTGETGIGKTALVEAFLRQAAQDQSVWVAQGQCLEHYGAGEAYLPVLEAISRLCQERGRERFAESLRRRAPAWLQQMPWLVADGEREALQREAAGATRERMLREMAETLEALTRETTLVLALEDLHWSDYSTLDLVSYLARRRGAARLMIVGTYRPADVSSSGHPLKAAKQELEMHRLCAELALEFLTESAVAEYLTVRFPGSRLPAEFVRLIHERTEGNPLFMAGVVEYLLAEGWLAKVGEQWELKAAVEEVVVKAPTGIGQMIEKQIEALGPEEQRVLEAASVAGAEFSAATVAAGLSAEAVRVEEQCEQLHRRRQFIKALGAGESPDGTMTAHYGFIHALYQNALYDRLAPVRRARLHRQIGEYGEAAYGERAREIAAELAMHFEQGRDYRRAVKYLTQAAENAVRRTANHEAVALLRRGLDLLKLLPESDERIQQDLRLQIILGEILGTASRDEPKPAIPYENRV
ncbi:MAG: AAA family ATPase [Blastocatellia bacterium]